MDPWDYPSSLLFTLCEDCHKREEQLKSVDFYTLLGPFGLTREQMMILADHIAYNLTAISPQANMMIAFNDILELIVPREQLKDYTEWLKEFRVSPKNDLNG